MSSRGRILIVGDENILRESLTRWFSADTYEVIPAPSGTDALSIVAGREFDLALLDIKMPGMDGIELQTRLKEADPDLPIILMTGHASVGTAVQALKQGAWDYITKPVDPDELSHLVANAIEHRHAKQEITRLRESLNEIYPATDIICRSRAMKRVTEFIGMVSPADATILITGESGTGKNVVARAIHASGRRRHMPLVNIHCGGLLESELFGHERGAFTGAQYRKKGKFELADGGTVFLDEISDVSLRMQTDLLRALQENEIMRVGGNHPVKVDFRCIAATNKDLMALVKAGTFCPDLYDRLQVVCIGMPPLRERREDIPLLADHFVRKHCARTNRQSIPPIASKAMDLLTRYDWPGNVRELENAVERALVTGRGRELEPADFSFQLTGAATTCSCRTLEEVERAHIERIWRESDGNHSRAARVLDIDRTTLYNKLKRYGLK